MKYRRLGKTQEEVSILGFGASPMGDVFEVSDEQDGIRGVHYALDHGVNFFDVVFVSVADALADRGACGK